MLVGAYNWGATHRAIAPKRYLLHVVGGWLGMRVYRLIGLHGLHQAPPASPHAACKLAAHAA